MSVENDWEPDMSKAFPGSPDDMMNTIAALRDRNATLEGICRSAGLCMSCLYGAPEPIGCTDCLGTGWDGGSPYDQIKVLEARVAKLETALKKLHEYAASVWFDEARTSDEEIELMAEARAALKDAMMDIHDN